jgi:predicted small lipoprotein YifL
MGSGLARAVFEGARGVLMSGAAAVALAGTFASLAGCGQKGPLYMPDQGGEVVTRPAGQTQSPETAPQPSTQTPRDTPSKPEGDKKNQPPR